MAKLVLPPVIGLVTNPPNLIVGTTLAAAAFAFLIGGISVEIGILLTLLFALLSGAQNSINAWTDIVADKVSWPKRPLPMGVSRNHAKILSISLFGAATFVLAFILVVHFSLVLLFIISFDMFLRITYSNSPPRLKRYPLVSNLIAGSHAVSFPFASAVVLGGGPRLLALPLALILFLQAVATLILEDFVTMEGDKTIGDVTLPLALGRSKAAVAAATAFFGAIVVALYSFILQASVLWLLVIGVVSLQAWAALRLRFPSTHELRTYHVAGLLVFLTGTILVLGFVTGTA